MINLIITILLLCYIIVKEYFSYKERKDLYDRLMAKIYEYQELSQEKPKDESSSNFIKANIDKLKINNNGIS